MSKHVVCIGAALVDELYYSCNDIMHATTNEAVVAQTAGGVSRNIAHQLVLLGVPVQLICVLGKDDAGNFLRTTCGTAGIGLEAAVSTQATGKYTGIINKDGSLFTAFITNSSEHLITPDHLQQHEAMLSAASFILFDTNIPVESMQWLINLSRETGVALIIEPVSVLPARKIANINLEGVFLITPNEDELPALCSALSTDTESRVKEVLGRGVQNIWLHQGAAGSVWYSNFGTISLPAPTVEITDCTGAGDGSVAGWILGKWLGKSDEESLQIAHSLAAKILQVKGAIASDISQQQLLQSVTKYYPT
ncbi:MAG: PfkB family carbohydrate kinase [Chitinophagaceae bacterium]